MNRQHQRTLEAIFAHPLRHGLRAHEVEALCRDLGADVDRSGDHRLTIRMPGGQDTWIRIGEGVHHPDLDAEAILRVRHLLEAAGVRPDHPQADPPSPRGNVAVRLVLHLSHRATEVFRLEAGEGGEAVEHAVLHPHGVWGSGENLTHRHDRDVAGQRAPRDTAYLAQITAAIAAADAVLLLGHGTGESDMRQVLLDYLHTHRPDLLARIAAVETVEARGIGPAGLVAIAHQHFGNLPRRHAQGESGGEVRQP
jgi:hypothetical protein